MPYIDKNKRNKYSDTLYDLSNIDIETKGELEYLIFSLMIQYMKNKEYRYSILHDCTYAATHCGDEFRRRFLDAREDSARTENGDC